MKCAASPGGTAWYSIAAQTPVNTVKPGSQTAAGCRAQGTDTAKSVDALRVRKAEHVDAGASDSCARLSPYCSVSIVRYDISCGGHVTEYIVSGSMRRASQSAAQTGRSDSVRTCPSRDWPRNEAHDLDRRARRDAEEAVGRRAVGKPDRRRARRHHPQRRDRQGAPARTVRPRQVAVLGGAAAAQAALAHAHAAGVAAGDARQHRAGARLRLRGRGRAGADRERHSDRPAPHPAGTDRGNLPLADRRSRQRGLLLLRRAVAHQPALLRLSLARRLSAARTCGATTGGRSAASSKRCYERGRRPSPNGRRARSRRRARCGSDRRRGRG